MDPDKGTAQTSISLASLANTSANSYYFTAFCSGELKGAQTVSANTWNYGFAAAVSNVSANFPNSGTSAAKQPVYINVYVWRPSTNAKVGTVLDSTTASLYYETTTANTEMSEFGTFAGSAVTAADKDVIVAEIWFQTTQATATSRTCTFYFDGTVETNNTGTTVSDHASYIETPQTLTFYAVKILPPETVAISESPGLRIIPSAGSNADIKTKKMTLTLDATSGVHDQAFTGVGFQPKAMIVFGVLTTGSAYAEGYGGFYGFSDGSSHNACVSGASVDNVSTYDCSQMVRNDACIDLLSTAAGNAELVRGVVKTFDSNGVTITWNVKGNTTQYIIHALFIGGSNITNVFVGQTTVGTTSTGTKGYTGVGFKPDIELFATAGNVSVNTLTAGAPMAIGASVSGVKQFANLIKQMDNVATNGAQGAGIWFGANQCLVACKNASGVSSLDLKASFTSHDTDGFTLTHNIAPIASTFPFIFMCIKGGLWDVGTLQQKTSAGIQTINPLVYADPEAFLVTITDDSHIDPISITNASPFNNTMAIGACDNTAEGYIAFGDVYQASPCRTVMISSTTKLIRNLTPAATATSSTTDSEADISDMATLGDVDINWTTADATVRWVGYVILQKGPVATGNNITRTMPTETNTISEPAAPARLAAKIRTGGTQTVAITEISTTRLAAKIRALALQTITVSEPSAPARVRNKPRSPPAETITVATGTAARLSAKSRSIPAQTVTITEISLVRLATKIRALAAQTTSITEPSPPSRLAAKKRAPSSAESTTIAAGTAARLATKIRALPIETTTIATGTLTRIKGAVKALLPETITIGTGTLTRIKGIVRALPTETIIVASGTLARLATKIRALSAETITIAAGTAARLVAKIRALPAQTATIGENVARTVFHPGNNITRSLPTETITIATGTAARLAGKIRALPSETAIIGEILARIKTAKRAIPAETTTIATGTAVRIKGAVKSIPAQTVAITEQSLTRLAAKIRALPTQILTIGEAVTQFKTTFGANNVVRAMPPETILIAENLVRRTQKVRTLALQTLIVAEDVARKAAKIRALPAQTVIISENIARIKQKIRAVPPETVLISEILTRKAAKTRIISQILSILEQIDVYKNGIKLIPPQRPDKGGWFWKPPRIKMIKYPVYIVSERERVQRRQRLHEYPPLIIIPAFKFQINTVVAPFVVTNPISQTVTVRFAIAPKPKTDAIITYSGKAIPISIPPKQQQKRLNKAKCASFIANQQAIERYSRKLNKLSKVMMVWSMAHQLFSSH